MKSNVLFALLPSVLVLPLVACGGGGPMGPTPTEIQKPTVTVSPTSGRLGTDFKAEIGGLEPGQPYVVARWNPTYGDPQAVTCSPYWQYDPTPPDAAGRKPACAAGWSRHGFTFNGGSKTPGGPMVYTSGLGRVLPVGENIVQVETVDRVIVAGPTPFTVTAP